MNKEFSPKKQGISRIARIAKEMNLEPLKFLPQRFVDQTKLPTGLQSPGPNSYLKFVFPTKKVNPVDEQPTPLK